MRVMVTGSAGLVGAVLCESLRKAGHTPVPFDVRTDPSQDIRDPLAVASAARGCDGVMHLAAVSRVAWGEADPTLCDDINVGGTEAVIDGCFRLAQRPFLIFASSREVYGNPVRFPVRETDTIAPVNTYGRSKAEGERLIGLAARRGLRTGIVRLSNVYGTVNDHPDRAVPALLWRALQGDTLEITGENMFFDFVHSDDSADGLLRAAAAIAGGRILPPLHIATGVATTLKDLATAAVRLAGNGAPILVRESRSFDVSGFQGDPGMTAAALDLGKATPLDDGLKHLAAAMRLRNRPLDPVPLPPSRAVDIRRTQAV